LYSLVAQVNLEKLVCAFRFQAVAVYMAVLQWICFDLQDQSFGYYQIHVRVDLVELAKVVDQCVGRVKQYVQVNIFATIRIEFLQVQIKYHGKQCVAKIV
jgi:hypothetical protein